MKTCLPLSNAELHFLPFRIYRKNDRFHRGTGFFHFQKETSPPFDCGYGDVLLVLWISGRAREFSHTDDPLQFAQRGRGGVPGDGRNFPRLGHKRREGARFLPQNKGTLPSGGSKVSCCGTQLADPFFTPFLFWS